jgi:hypothetical protein
MSEDFKICLLRCKTINHIDQLSNFLQRLRDNNNDLGPLRREFKRNKITKEYKKLNGFVTLISNKFYNKLSKYDEIKYISEFKINENNIPPDNSYNHCFFPYTENNILLIESIFSFLFRIGFLSSNDLFIHKNGIIEFSDKVSLDKRIKIKFLIDNCDLRISWCKKCNKFDKNHFYFECNK